MLSIALAKGRLLEPSVASLRAAGLDLPGADELDRRLIWMNDALRLILAKPADVPTLVRYGGADAGLCGSDVLGEGEHGLAEPLSLGIGRCRLALAARADGPVQSPADCQGRRIASKYPVTARRFFTALDIDVELVQMHGSVEIGPLTGLSDAIVDLVETGRTLKENGLREIALVANVEAKLVVSRSALKLKQLETAALIANLRRVVEQQP
jgi:ATP phosphoribosyltransferase